MLIIPAAWKSVETGRATACTSKLRQLGGGLNAYLADHELTMPTMKAGRLRVSEPGPVLDTVLLPYLPDKKSFACPSDSKIARASGTSYYWNNTINGQRIGSLDFMHLTDNPSRIPIMADKEGFHPYLEKKVNMLYADGHATKDLKFVTDNPE
jgi:prepilin-type processing-associated H-X9-DG protein